ncbi:MAG: hypothetical protein FGM57_01400, partial [Candidatus Taylorbacteria bacterium]|nr:hypothetical protein [Candidatus Taylorbacteria bacterium]
MESKKYTHITPAILPKSFDDLVQHLERISSIAHSVQIDVVDGVFTNNKTWPYIQDHDGMFKKIVGQEEGLPYWETFDFEVDLMVSDPAFVADQWIAAGANRVIVHTRSITKENLLKLASNVRDKGVEIYIGVELRTREKTKEYLTYITAEKGDISNVISGIQCMGISEVGFQHSPFNEEVLDMIREFKKEYPTLPISVDGGVTLDNAGEIYDAGAERLVSGSTVFESGDIRAVMN